MGPRLTPSVLLKRAVQQQSFLQLQFIAILKSSN